MAKRTEVIITAPNFKVVEFLISGNSNYVQHRWSKIKRGVLRGKHEQGDVGKKRKKPPRDFKADYEGVYYGTKEGWYGIPSAAFRKAMVSACRLIGYSMPKAKMAIFILADGFDKDDNTNLTKITKGTPKPCEHITRNANMQPDLRIRAMWAPGWEAKVRVRYDADMFSLEDVTNLMMRAGLQVGIGDGRPDSTKSCGMDWGTFDLVKGQPKIKKPKK